MVNGHAILSWGRFCMPGEHLLTGQGFDGFVSTIQSSPAQHSRAERKG